MQPMARSIIRAVKTTKWGSALAVVLLTGAGCTPMDDVFQAIFGRSMRVQSSLGAYEHPLPPPEGAVPFSAGNFPAAAGAVNLGQPEVTEIPKPVTLIQLIQQAPEVTEIPNPVEATPASLARGETMFNRACQPCHGSLGNGDGPVTNAGMPSFGLTTPQAVAFTDGYIYSLIRIGRGAMPPYGHQIAHYDRWHIVNYVRELQRPLALPEEPIDQSEDLPDQGGDPVAQDASPTAQDR